MNAPLLDQIVCRHCDAVLDAADNFCRHCSAPTADRPHSPVALPPAPPAPRQLLRDNPWAMLGLLFMAMGPLALPMLWSGRAFGRRGKIAVTLLVVSQTVAIVWIGYYVAVMLIIKPLQEAFQL